MPTELIINSVVGTDKKYSAQYSAWHIKGTQEIIDGWIGGWVGEWMDEWLVG